VPHNSERYELHHLRAIVKKTSLLADARPEVVEGLNRCQATPGGHVDSREIAGKMGNPYDRKPRYSGVFFPGMTSHWARIRSRRQ
jgi:hypothetical protein